MCFREPRRSYWVNHVSEPDLVRAWHRIGHVPSGKLLVLHLLANASGADEAVILAALAGKLAVALKYTCQLPIQT